METYLTCLILIIFSCSVHGEKYVIGVDAGTESIRVGVFSSDGHLIGTSAVPYETSFPKPGWAEQHPHDWWASLGTACQKALLKSGISVNDIAAIAIDSTACSVIALNERFDPIRPCLLWMDSRSSSQTLEILRKGANDDALLVNCGGYGPLSAEWMIPKSLWIKQNEPSVWEAATVVCEMQDYLNYKLTGEICSSSCNVAARWHWNGDVAAHFSNEASDKTYPGRPVSLLNKIGLQDILEKWPSKCIAMGKPVGKLHQDAAAHLGLRCGTLVCQGGPDAYVGMVGLGCIRTGQLCLITGSSHLHLCIGAKAEQSHAKGIWGPYMGAPLIGLCFAGN